MTHYMCDIHVYSLQLSYGVASISRLLKVIGLFCRIESVLQGSFAKETCNFKEPTNRSHPIYVRYTRVQSATQLSDCGVRLETWLVICVTADLSQRDMLVICAMYTYTICKSAVWLLSQSRDMTRYMCDRWLGSDSGHDSLYVRFTRLKSTNHLSGFWVSLGTWLIICVTADLCQTLDMTRYIYDIHIYSLQARHVTVYVYIDCVCLYMCNPGMCLCMCISTVYVCICVHQTCDCMCVYRLCMSVYV